MSRNISSLWKIKRRTDNEYDKEAIKVTYEGLGKIMFGFDKMFDFNRDGKLNSWERAAQFQFMDEMMKDDEKSIFDDDDEIDTFADAGLDYDELEFMDPDERREVLEDAGLD